ncbi:SRPBCC domain-containing protein, partial [Streptomyces sp. NPDC057927]
MQLDHSFTVLANPDDAWKLFLDLGRVAPCMPGAVLDTLDGDSFTGRVKVKVGAVQMSYRGEGTVSRDGSARSMHL